MSSLDQLNSALFSSLLMSGWWKSMIRIRRGFSLSFRISCSKLSSMIVHWKEI